MCMPDRQHEQQDDQIGDVLESDQWPCPSHPVSIQRKQYGAHGDPGQVADGTITLTCNGEPIEDCRACCCGNHSDYGSHGEVEAEITPFEEHLQFEQRLRMIQASAFDKEIGNTKTAVYSLAQEDVEEIPRV